MIDRDTRYEVLKTISEYKDLIKLVDDAIVLDVGIAGDGQYEIGKKGGNYKFFQEYRYFTLDIDKKLKPDFVADICKTDFPDNTWDLIVLSQTIEHIYKPHDAIKECARILKKEGYLIVDAPCIYPFHDHDYWRITPECFQRMCKDAGFQIVKEYASANLISCLARKK